MQFPKPRTSLSVMAVTLAFLVLAFWVGGAAEILEQVIVKVNGEILTKTELESREVSAIRARNQQQMSDDELKKAITEVTPRILVDTIDEMLLLQRGRELGYKLGDEQFKDVLDKIKKDNKIENEEQFQAALKQEGLTLAELRKSIEKNMIINRVQQNEVLGKVAVTDSEARAFYAAHKAEFSTPATMMIREILVAIPADDKGVNVAKDEEAKQKAAELRSRIIAGESFEKLASEASESASKANGGLIGPIKLDELDANLRKVFTPMKAGEVSPVLRTSRGWQIFKVESKTEAKVPTFEQVRDQISNAVAQTKQRAEFAKFVLKLRTESLIEWKNAELKKLYDQQVAEDLKASAAAAAKS